MRQDNTVPVIVLDVVEDTLAVLLVEIILAWIEYLSIGISFPKGIGNIEDVCLQEGVSKCTHPLFYAQSPDFLKPGLCYFLKFLYL